MIIDFLGGSYQQRYVAYNPERTINFLPIITQDGEKNKSKMALFSTPGLSTFSSPSGTNMRGLYTARTHASLTPGKCFTIVDQTLYQIATNGTATSRGTLTDITNDATSVFMVSNASDELGIFHSSASYVFNMSTNTLTKITSGQFPGSVTSAAFMDGYTIVTVSSGAVYWASGNDMLTGWNSLNVFSPTFTPAETRAVVTYNQQIYAFTAESVEVYVTDATATFARLPRTTSLIGLVARESLAVFNDGIIFLGRSAKGEAAVYMMEQNYNCKKIPPSTSLTWRINNTSSDLSSAYGFIQYSKEGHLLYFLTLPGITTTFVFDFETGLWHERNSCNPNTSTDGVFRGRYYTNFDGKNLYGDLYGASIMKEDYTVYTEDGVGAAQAITRTRISPTFNDENKLISVHEIEIIGNTGCSNSGATNAKVSVSYSTDNGNTYNTARDVYLGAQAVYGWRARLPKLGSGRNWTLKLVLTDPIDLMISDMTAKGSFGSR